MPMQPDFTDTTPFPADATTQAAVAYDLFPAILSTTAPDPAHSTADFSPVRAIFITSPTPRLLVLGDGPQGPRALVDAPFDYTHIFGDTRTGFDVYAALDPANPTHASIVHIRPLAHCGCGSRLRSFRPFSTMRHTAAPPSAGPLPAPALAPIPAQPLPAPPPTP